MSRLSYLDKALREERDLEIRGPGERPDLEPWDEQPDLTAKTGRGLRVAWTVFLHLGLWALFSMPALMISISFTVPPQGWVWYSLASGLLLLALLRRRQLAAWYQRWRGRRTGVI